MNWDSARQRDIGRRGRRDRPLRWTAAPQDHHDPEFEAIQELRRRVKQTRRQQGTDEKQALDSRKGHKPNW